METPSWRDEAACKGVNPELFFPVRGDTYTTVAAKAVCSQCIVRTECLEYALINHERMGIWGGMSERQRRQAWRRAS